MSIARRIETKTRKGKGGCLVLDFAGSHGSVFVGPTKKQEAQALVSILIHPSIIFPKIPPLKHKLTSNLTALAVSAACVKISRVNM